VDPDGILAACGDAYTLDPWPFGAERVVVHATGRLLEAPFADQERMREYGRQSERPGAQRAIGPWLHALCT